MSWHVDRATWTAYAGNGLDPIAEAAVEAHVTACPDCRAGARELVPDVGPVWAAVHAEISRPRRSWLARLGIPEADLVVAGAARDLLLSWSVAVGAAVCCALLTGLAPIHLPGGAPALFLILAPLIPVLAVVAAYDATDPLRSLTGTTPYSPLRLALLRTAAALTAAVPLTVASALVVPALHGYFAAWLLPGLALTVAALILLKWLTAWVACAVVGAGWLVVATTASVTALTTTPGQVTSALGVTVLAAVLVRVNRGVAR
ncbi:zf-HC2 domain-containing protein [Actinoplanes bogorensis]|uniref:Zf-HC2 domain-containing protein n=1 Tax=Paractinoplanes bogorensis TaxID=1610840 RepID=A0ABS5YKN6_9ACTN|nr:zf-HC2 domain-containing protein [Actinoplanes bogorensis]MBU2664025.1 zf-HC2 domain-containing protein [Actinoplanes bogorensis]